MPEPTVHISPAKSESGTERRSGPDRWAALGFTLKGLLTESYGVQETRMDLAPALDTEARYDVELVLPHPESPDQIASRVQRALEQEFALDISRQNRSTDILVLTAPNGKSSAGARMNTGMNVGAFATSWHMDKPADIPATPADMEEFILSLQRRIPAIGRGFAHLDTFMPFAYGLLIVGEPDPEGDHPIQIECVGPRTSEDLIRALRDDLGITATRDRRDVEMLVVRPVTIS
jgi:uncharacterized protein (TIGR03435 family)